MLRAWPTTHLNPSIAALGALCTVLACSSAGTDQISDSLGTGSDGSGGTGSQENTGSQSDTATSPASDSGDNGSTGFETSPTTSGGSTGDPMPATSTTTGDPTAPGTTGTTGGPEDTTGDLSTSTGDTTGSDTTGDGSSSTGTPEGCSDGEQNGDETDIDCGGTCAPCLEGKVCAADGDCDSGSCDAGLCVAATCQDGKQDGDETDIDCGGATCDDCLEGESCKLGADCDSDVCEANLCVAPACDDEVKNADETDVDCGGATCLGCGVGLDCELADDCDSGVCTGGACVAGTCGDGVQNGMETGIDCGSPSCAPCQLAHLTINEVDYDNVGTDLAEFVEIYNNTGAPVDLATVRLLGANGTNNATYLNISLAAAGTLMQGQYLVIGPPALTVPPGVLKVDSKAKDVLENGAPDGIALVDTGTMTVLDALSYEGSMTMANLTGLGITNLVEGVALDAKVLDSNDIQRSLVRFPNGNDKDNAATDWVISKNPTPGLPNLP